MELLACQVWVAGTGGGGDGKKKREENCGVALLPGRTVDSWPEVTVGESLTIQLCKFTGSFFFLSLNVCEEGELKEKADLSPKVQRCPRSHHLR